MPAQKLGRITQNPLLKKKENCWKLLKKKHAPAKKRALIKLRNTLMN
jgi:hypothetical protein